MTIKRSDRHILYQRYINEKLTASVIAKELAVSTSTIYKWLKYYGIELRSRGEAIKLSRRAGRIDEKGRICTKCGRWKLWKHFCKNRCGPKGYASSCKCCDRKKRVHK